MITYENDLIDGRPTVIVTFKLVILKTAVRCVDGGNGHTRTQRRQYGSPMSEHRGSVVESIYARDLLGGGRDICNVTELRAGLP